MIVFIILGLMACQKQDHIDFSECTTMKVQMRYEKNIMSGTFEKEYIDDLQKIIDSYHLNKIENLSENGWIIFISLYDNNNNENELYVLGNKIFFNDECYEVSDGNMNELIQFIENICKE